MSDSEHICPICDQSFLGETLACPVDGAKLLVADSTQAHQDRIGQCIDGKVTILKPLGKGAMGAVYRAHQDAMQRDVAVKILHRKDGQDVTTIRRFLREARIASGLRHPNAVTLFDYGQSESGELYLVMELLDGVELATEIDRIGPMAPARAVGIIAQVCDALQHAHEAGLVHRDVKPANIFLLQDVRRRGDFVKVLDFGLARSQKVEESVSVTQSGTVVGTPAYMSPEQATSGEATPRSDVYSIGVVLYELLAGVRPFSGSSIITLLMKHANDPPPPLSEVRPDLLVPTALEAAVMQALEKDPLKRPESAAAFSDLLHEAVSPALAEEVHRPVPDRRPPPALPASGGLPTALSGAETPPAASSLTLEAVRQGLGPSPRARWLSRAALGVAGLVAAAVLASGALQPKGSIPILPGPPEAAPQGTTPLSAAASNELREVPGAVAAVQHHQTPRRTRELAIRAGSRPTEPAPAAVHVAAPVAVPLKVTTTPTRALLSVDGKPLGRSPTSIPHPTAGTFELTVSRAGYRTARREVEAGQQSPLHVRLIRLPKRDTTKPLTTKMGVDFVE